MVMPVKKIEGNYSGQIGNTTQDVTMIIRSYYVPLTIEGQICQTKFKYVGYSDSWLILTAPGRYEYNPTKEEINLGYDPMSLTNALQEIVKWVTPRSQDEPELETIPGSH